jgi:zinc transport system ATP-binding protein
MSLVELKTAGLYRDQRWLVRNIDLTVAAGEIVTLIGPNGSGKSTTVKLALGIHQPSEGTAEQKPDLRVGYVPQKITVDWTLPLTVNRLLNLTTKLTVVETEEALEKVGIPHLARANIQTLSGGEFQRALMARAVARKPNLLVLDEPVQGVDFAGEIALYELISELRDSLQCGVLLISHDLHMVMASTDKVLCLNGHLCCQGTPKAVSENDEYRRLFGGRAADAMAVYKHHHDHTHLPDGRVQHADGTVTDNCHHEDGHHV